MPYAFPTAPPGIFQLDGNKPVPHGYGINWDDPLAEGLFAYYAMWENASETVYNLGNRPGVNGDMVMETMAPDSWFPAEFGPAITADGTAGDSLITENTFAQDDFEQFTLMSLFRFTSQSDDNAGVFGRSEAFEDGEILIGARTNGDIRTFSDGSAGTAIQAVSGFDDGAWHVVHWVRVASDDHRLYVGGLLTGSSGVETGSIAPASAQQWVIGRRFNAGFDFIGDIALCAAWSRALDPDEITEASQPCNWFRLITPDSMDVGDFAIAAGQPQLVDGGLVNRGLVNSGLVA